MPNQTPDPYQDIRDAVRQLCAGFPDAYHRQIDAERSYPTAFVDALTHPTPSSLTRGPPPVAHECQPQAH